MSWKYYTRTTLLLSLFCLCSCQKDSHLFKLRKDTGIDFKNELIYTEEFNPYTYRNFYNGAGVALGDINNDGLIDVYLTGNIVGNKMYLNKGGWKFEDITEITGLGCKNVWSSGANFVDINGDGLLDLYVCKAGKPEGEKRYNELFINKGNLKFEEQSRQYGLDIKGLSIQSAFFDFDKDGDLDCYLLNNSIKAIGGFDFVKDSRNTPSPDGNKFLENRNGVFVDITKEAGIYSSAIGFGLGITLSDFNLDNWTDIYISNDYFEKDYLYINNKDGSFSEEGEKYFSSFPLGAMGADAADLDNDLKPDLMITEMLPSSLERKKTKANYESWKKYSLAVSKGYAHQQPRNMLQKNLGGTGFVELGRKAGVQATDWSWSSLLQDFNNDGYKDIIITNGIYKDLLDRDYLAFIANDTRVKQLIDKGGDAIKTLIDSMPSKAITNKAYKNIGDFNFEDASEEWGFSEPSFSNGCAYGDLDNDGDLDLVINNVNMPSHIYENTSEKFNNSYIKLRLKGNNSNTKAIGSKVIVYACNKSFMSEQFPSRGFQSSVPNELLLGLANCTSIDSLVIIWPSGNTSTHKNLAINTGHTVSETNSIHKLHRNAYKQDSQLLFLYKDTLQHKHKTFNFNQFNRERLLHKMNTRQGPAISLADLNSDGKDDVFIGGSKNQSSVMLLSSDNNFTTHTVDFEKESNSEVIDCQFFDMDLDGDLDLYVAHGGTSFSSYTKDLDDIIYENIGNAKFIPRNSSIQFPQAIATGAIAIKDYNNDGYPDIFIGDRASNANYGTSGSGYLFENKKDGNFELVNIPIFNDLGMISCASWIDVNKDDLPDLIVAGEWMPISIFINTESGFENHSKQYGFENTIGLYNTIFVQDLNNDGLDDIIIGNQGTNSTLKTNNKLYLNDFDLNGRIDAILTEQIGEEDYPVHDMDELVSQFPFLKKKFIYYKDYAQASMINLFPKDILNRSKVVNLHELESKMYIQNAAGFEPIQLPAEIQYSSIHSIVAHDFDKDGILELILGGNHYLIKPQFGREDASSGWYLKQKSKNEYSIIPLGIQGEIRRLKINNSNDLIVGINNAAISRYYYKKE